MKIVLVGPVYPYRGGIAHFTTRLANELIQEGHGVNLISYKRQYPKWLYPGQSDRDPSKEPFSSIEASFVLDPIYPWTWFKAVKQIIQISPDMVIIQWWTTFWAFAYASIVRALEERGIRTGFLVHNVVPHETRPWDRLLVKMALVKGKFFIVMSSAQKELLRKLIPAARIRLVEHPIYDLYTNHEIDRKSARQRLGLPEDLRIVLFFGIVRPYKGLSVLVEAVGRLAAKRFPIGLYIAGEFWEDVQKYRDQIERLKITDKVWIDNRYVPNEDVPVIFSAADVFVAPYTGGTQSGAVKMALGFGLPVVVTLPLLDESMRSWLDRGVFSCPPNDPGQLLTALNKAINFGIMEETKGVKDKNWYALISELINLFQSPL